MERTISNSRLHRRPHHARFFSRFCPHQSINPRPEFCNGSPRCSPPSSGTDLTSSSPSPPVHQAPTSLAPSIHISGRLLNHEVLSPQVARKFRKTPPSGRLRRHPSPLTVRRKDRPAPRLRRHGRQAPQPLGQALDRQRGPEIWPLGKTLNRQRGPQISAVVTPPHRRSHQQHHVQLGFQRKPCGIRQPWPPIPEAVTESAKDSVPRFRPLATWSRQRYVDARWSDNTQPGSCP